MKKGIGKLFRSPALLVIAVVVMMAAATLAYAHWSGTAHISGDVQTGYIGMGFYDASTNDDGMENEWDGGDWGGPDDAYDHWFYECGWDDDLQEPIYCDDSSADPMMPGADPERYAKDVARCSANPHGENELYFSVENGYPSYYCTVAGYMTATGSVPVMTDGMDFDPDEFYRWQCGPWYPLNGDPADEWYDHVSWDEENKPFADHNGDGIYNGRDFYLTQDCVFDYDFEVIPQPDGSYHVYNAGLWVLSFGPEHGVCGVQVDPWYGDWQFEGPPVVDPYQLWVHVENDALQEWSYHLGIKAKFINWNEYEDFASDYCKWIYPY